MDRETCGSTRNDDLIAEQAHYCYSLAVAWSGGRRGACVGDQGHRACQWAVTANPR
jgi:hypothetical protein